MNFWIWCSHIDIINELTWEKSEESNIHFMPDDGVFAPGSADLLACQAGSWTNAESNN